MPFDATKSSKAACDTLTERDSSIDVSLYPSSSLSANVAIHDLGYLQRVFANEENFTTATSCDVFEIDQFGTGQWTIDATDEIIFDILSGERACTARYLFFKLDSHTASTFGTNISIGMASRQRIFNVLNINPHFATFLLGLYAVNHIPPTGLDVLDEAGNLIAIDFVCQQPRWGFRERIPPISTLSTVSLRSGVVTCITSASPGDPRLNVVRSRLTAAFTASRALPAGLINASSPFMLPCLITHECFMASDYRIVDLASTLFGAVDTIDESRQVPFDREVFKDLTFKLHRVSQDADFLVSSVEIGIMMTDAMMQTQGRIAMFSKRHRKVKHQGDAPAFLRRALQSRQRWLYNAKSKKDTAMTLVYNIVSQQDTEANMAIARDTKNDSSSMKTIAVLTMIFLPASTMASFFGMCFFEDGERGFTVDPQVWLFPAVTIPTTLMVLLIWWIWNFSARSAHLRVLWSSVLSTIRPSGTDLRKKLDDIA
ncbi:Hypothetical protein D9617_3g022480 [Elsinoe fawcettii]|nr:Hypothetical protein D9617_3g022480 [Elsinoe fawcettii]